METQITSTPWFEVYGAVHHDRRNLAIHLATQPLFAAGFAGMLIGPFVGAYWLLAAGPFAMLLAIAAQGGGHRFELRAPEPFRSARDVVVRLLTEQLVTFPRFVLSGELVRAWRAAR